MIKKNLSNKSGKRFLLPHISLTRTFPYGYTEEDLHNTNSDLSDKILLENLAYEGNRGTSLDAI